MLSPESTNFKTKFAQYQAYENHETRSKIAKQFIETKISKSEAVLDYLKQRYPEIEYDFTGHKAKLERVTSISELMGVDGDIAWKYWVEYSKAVPEEYDFKARIDKHRRPMGAGDKTNVLLNYGYSLLEAECLRVINSVGLDSHVGFLHEMNPSKHSLTYDLQEQFRFIVDMAVISLIEKRVMENRDFIRTESYSLRLKPFGARKLTDEFNSMMNSKVEYRKKNTTWGSVLLLKGGKLAQYLVGKRKTVDFNKPTYVGNGDDTDLLRKKILAIGYKEWQEMGFSKSTLHYMKKNAKDDKPFTLNAHVRERLKIGGGNC